MIQWSPKRKEEYATEINGKMVGVGVLECFDEFPGLWNLFWLHSYHVDYLQTPEDYKQWEVPSTLLDVLEDMGTLCGARPLVDVAHHSTLDQFVDQVMKYDCQFSTRLAFDQFLNWESWVEIKKDRATEIRARLEDQSVTRSNQSTGAGQVIKVDFRIANRNSPC